MIQKKIIPAVRTDNITYAVRDIVVLANEVAKSGKEMLYLNSSCGRSTINWVNDWSKSGNRMMLRSIFGKGNRHLSSRRKVSRS